MQTLHDVLLSKKRGVRTTVPETTVLEAVDEMCRARVGALVVLIDDCVAGIFSERDLMTRVVLEQRNPATTHVGEVMTTSVVFAKPGTTPREAMSVMTYERLRHLPIMDGSRLVGIVSIGDLVRGSLEERERVIDELERYCSGRYPG
jgi:CBS domain-containing protein